MTNRKVLISEDFVNRLMSADASEALELVRDLQAYKAGVERPADEPTPSWIHDRMPAESDGDYCGTAWALDAAGDVMILDIGDIVAGFDDTDGCPIIAWQPTGLVAPAVPGPEFFESIGLKKPDPVQEPPLGLETALRDLEEDPDTALWQCEVGAFDVADDPDTPFEVYSVVVAADSQDEANEKSVELAISLIATQGHVDFSATSDPVQALPSDFDQ